MKAKKKPHLIEFQLQFVNELVEELEYALSLKEKANQVLAKVNAELSKSINSKNKLLDHYEQTIKSCESACIHHQDRADKAEKIIGRMMVEQELG